jgi:hypothetical protein
MRIDLDLGGRRGILYYCLKSDIASLPQAGKSARSWCVRRCIRRKQNGSLSRNLDKLDTPTDVVMKF